MEKWNFGIDNGKLINLVLNGTKTATSYLYKKEDVPDIGSKSIIIFDNEKEACIVETKKYIITEFKNITSDLAYLEGEDDKSLEAWKRVHKKYFTSINKDFNENTKIIFEIFEVVENLIEKRLKLGKKISLCNEAILGKLKTISEINAGFNNTLFVVNNKYVIKVCTNIELENEFEIEYDFYINNINNKYIPILYKYDDSKKEIEYIYEIMEKLSGKTLYYYWYKMDEMKREKTIKKLIDIVSSFHKKVNTTNDWAKQVKDEVNIKISECKELFNEKDYKKIINSLKLYDEYLKDNHYTLIHNDLHFDNILYDKDKLKIIDFNDSIIAPIDYEFRQLYICVEKPWKWANIEMDPLQKPEDYKNLFKYIKKYYKELNNIKYLEKRMYIYRILNDVRHLKRYKSKELIDGIIEYSNKLIERD